MSFCGFVEGNVGEHHDDEVDKTSSREKSNEPGENLVTGARDCQKGQEGKAHGDGKAPDGHTISSTFPQESGRMALDRQGVQASARGVGIRVARREDAGDKQSIGEIWQNRDGKIPHGDDIRGSGGSSSSFTTIVYFIELLVVPRDDNAGAEGSKDEEDAVPPVHSLVSVLDVRSRTLGLASNHANVLGANDAEGGSPECSQKSLELSFGTWCHVLAHCSWVIPISEAIGVLFRIAAHHGNEGEAVEHEDQDDFASREPELGFSIGLNSKDIASSARWLTMSW